MHFVYGPIPSRRLGRSLGVDPIPLKSCNWNCVYCQLGRTSPLINERREWVPRADVVAEVLAAVSAHPPDSIDHISFVGSGEPTLHSGLGWMVRAVREQTAIPVAVITNGALLGRADVRADLLAADVVLPTLSAGDERLFRQIHRPHPDLSLAAMLDGMVLFRAAYAGKIWVEVMLIAGVNDGEDALRSLAVAMARVRPDQVHLILTDRPPTEPWVAPPDAEGLMRAEAILGAVAHVVPPSAGTFDLSGHPSLDEAVLAILQRHPMSEAQLADALAQLPSAGPEEALYNAELPARLVAGGHTRLITRHGVRFWTTDEQRFDPNTAPHGQATLTQAPSTAMGVG
jgi:wyosine [tRNA(Phe)-imidazoG37] synthetase (radical SAM superfamily)